MITQSENNPIYYSYTYDFFYSTIDSKQGLLSGLQKQESSLLEQERNLKLKLDQLRKALKDPSSNKEEGTN